MKRNFHPNIKVFDYETFDTKSNVVNRYGFHWSIQEDFALEERWHLFNKDIHKIAQAHKRSFKAVCLRLEQLKIVDKKFSRTLIEQQNKQYLS